MLVNQTTNVAVEKIGGVMIPWWVWPMIIFITGVAGFYYFEHNQRNFDFGMLAKSWICLILGVVVSLTIIIVKLLL